MTSKFFAAGNLSSESESEEEEGKFNQALRKTKNVAKGLESSDSENDKRKVVGEKEKKWSSIKKLCQRIKDKLKIHDFSQVSGAYQQLTKQIQKAKNVIEKEGYPTFYMKTMILLIDTVNNFEGKKDLNAINGKEFAKLKQKLKKYEKDFEGEIEKFRNVENEEPVEAEEKKDGTDNKKVSVDNIDVDDQDDQPPQPVSDTQSEEDDKSPLDSTDPMVRRTYWMLKKSPEIQKQKKQKEDKAKLEEGKQKQKEKERLLQQKKIQADTKGKKFKLAETKQRSTKFTSDEAKQTLKNVLKQIGKPIDEQHRQQLLTDIGNIKQNLTSDPELISALIVETLFIVETNRSVNKLAFKRPDWELIYNNINRMHKIISKSSDESLLTSIQSFQKEQQFYEPEIVLRSLVSFLNTLNEELRKALVFTDVSEIEYYQRLQDLLKLNELNYKLLGMYEERCDDAFSVSSLASQLIENTYYLSPSAFQKLTNQYQSSKQEKPSFLQIQNPELFARIAKLALKQAEKENRAKLVLYMVYNHAVFGRPEGKTLLLTTNIIDNIQNYSYYVQALFNRTLVQLGINAFIDGNLYEVQGALSDLCSTMRTKQLLAQGFLKQEQQVAQRKRMLPSYLHINIDMIESIELIASMLNEIPYTFKDGGRITSKTFKKIYQPYEKSHFIAEPLSSKDIIYSASKELQKANWKECYERLLQLDLWRLIMNPDTAKSNILKRVKQQALKCYVLANQASFSILKIDSLQAKFQLDSAKDVHTIINRLIFNGDLNAAATLDGHIRFYHVQINKMDKTIQELCQKASDLVSTNQTNLKQRLGTHATANEDEETIRRNKRRGVGSERNKLLGVKKVVVKQKKN